MAMPRAGRKEHVLEAAVALFSRKGYHGTTVREIGEEAGMLSGSLYAHMSGKEDLLWEIVLRAAEQFLGAVQPIVDGPGSASEKLRQAMRAHLRVVAGNIAAAAVFTNEWEALSPERQAVYLERRNAYEHLLAAIIRQGMASGEFRPMDEKFARLLVLSAVNWLYAWYKPDGPLGPETVADKFADLLLGGFISEGGGAP
jgi:TetR/AcrR family transcriptional regulator, cholesterol catabolism regulator